MSVVWIADDSDILCSRPDYIFCFKDGVAKLKISPFWSFMTHNDFKLSNKRNANSFLNLTFNDLHRK